MYVHCCAEKSRTPIFRCIKSVWIGFDVLFVSVKKMFHFPILHLFSRKKPGLHSKNYKSGSRIAGEKWREYLKMPNINLN
jgi:hypothetical protein